MDEDSSLEAFTGDIGAGGESAARDEHARAPEAGEGSEDPENSTAAGEVDSEDEAEATVAPTVSTYSYTPETAACRACGTRVRQRWRDDGEMVCGECKEW